MGVFLFRNLLLACFVVSLNGALNIQKPFKVFSLCFGYYVSSDELFFTFFHSQNWVYSNKLFSYVLKSFYTICYSDCGIIIFRLFHLLWQCLLFLFSTLQPFYCGHPQNTECHGILLSFGWPQLKVQNVDKSEENFLFLLSRPIRTNKCTSLIKYTP